MQTFMKFFGGTKRGVYLPAATVLIISFVLNYFILITFTYNYQLHYTLLFYYLMEINIPLYHIHIQAFEG